MHSSFQCQGPRAAQLPTRQEKGQQCASGTATHQTETQNVSAINAHGCTQKLEERTACMGVKVFRAEEALLIDIG
ncbi:hypothetical protein EYF80_024638 [Liparis tanakae]|uniref:Uncharacterized protein n=1 Tax=Liparis tanakae TaxID=230148 RepID=A0A4Z2HGX4_9TELE|nr:hypothetical protein EYF80_024638 [Liparis tanakae]